jgi:spore maturation protein SpmA
MEARASVRRPAAGELVLNWIWLGLVLTSVVFAAFTGRMEAVSKTSLETAKRAIELVIGLTGAMVFFLGLVRVASDGGLLRVIIRGLRPLLRRLFPAVPADHPAMTAIVMNFASNMLGLGNAATPFGLKAMVELDKLNRHKGVATDAMALFLAINTSSIVLLPPLGTVAVRVATQSESPFSIWVPTLFATICSTLAAVTVCLLLQRLSFFAAKPLRGANGEEIPAPAVENLPDLELPGDSEKHRPMGPWRWAILLSFTLAIALGYGLHVSDLLPEVGAFGVLQDTANAWLLPLLICGFLLIGVAGRVGVYDALVEGGKEGLEVAVRIAPFLVAILVAIEMFRASGALEALIGAIEPLTSAIGVPGEALPMALMRPLSGSGAFGIMTSTLETHGPDSFVGLLSSTLMGSTETTFYVLAIYLGAVRIRDARHILPACLTGDFAGFAGAVLACHFFFG